MILDELFTDKYLPYITSYRRSYWTDQPIYQNHVKSQLSKMPLNEIKHEHIVSVMTTASAKLGDATCNRLLTMLRYIFNLAVRWKMAGMTENPTSGYQKKKLSNFRERYLSAEETQEHVNVKCWMHDGKIWIFRESFGASQVPSQAVSGMYRLVQLQLLCSSKCPNVVIIFLPIH